MRILLANTGHPATIKGGAEAAVLDLAHALVARGHEVALVVHHGGRTLVESVEEGIRVYALPNRNVFFGFDGRPHSAPARLAWHALDSNNPLMARAFGQILDRERPDVVNTHVVVGLSQRVWLESARRGIPIVHYLHEYGTMCPRGSGFRDGRLCATPCLPCGLLTRRRKSLSRLVDTVVGVSRFTLERHLGWNFFEGARSTVIPNIFRDLAFVGRPAPQPGPLRLGYFGRLIPDKGPLLAIEALRGLPPDAVTLDIAGTGEESYVAALRAAAPPNVRVLGWTRAADFYPRIDIALVPSIWPDPQPRVTFEAYMHGRPVIGSDAGGIPEEIDSGTTGWLFKAGSATDLTRVIAERLHDRADRTLAAAGFEARLARLDPTKVVAEYESVYAGALERARARAAAGAS